MWSFIFGTMFGFVISSILSANNEPENDELWEDCIRLEQLYNEQRRQNEILLDALRKEDDGK